MKTESRKSISDLIRDNDLIQNALTQAIQDTVREHKLLGQPIVIWRDGKVVWVPPKKLNWKKTRRESDRNTRLAFAGPSER